MPKVSDTCAYLAPERNSDTGGTRPRLRTEQQGVLVARWVSAAPELDPGPDMGDLVFALFGDRPIPDEHDARHLRPLRQHARILPRKCRLPRRARRRSPLRILQRHRSRTLRSIAPYPSIPCPHMLAVCWQRQLCDRSPCSFPTPDPDRARRASPWIRGSDTSAPAPLSSCRLSSRVQILRGLSVSVLVCLCPGPAAVGYTLAQVEPRRARDLGPDNDGRTELDGGSPASLHFRIASGEDRACPIDASVLSTS